MQTSNYRHLGKGFYLVRTQAGFKQAAKHWWGPENGDVFDSHDYNYDTANYPTSYPCLIVFSSIYMGGSYALGINCIHVNRIKDIIKQA